MDVLFVCTGNTCRSPMAEAFMRGEARARGVDIHASSCGLEAMPGAMAAPEAVRAVAALGYELKDHRAKMVCESLLGGADLVVGMAPEHQTELKNRFPAYGFKLRTCFSIPDPYGRGEAVYRETAEQIEREVRRLMDMLCKTP